MKIALVATVAAALAAVLFAAQDKGKDDEGPPPMPPEMAANFQAGLERWYKTCKPNEKHAKLAALIGTWDVELRMWMGPGEPTRIKGTEEIAWKAKDRWIESRTHFDVNPYGGEGAINMTRALGYDVFKERYVSAMYDDFQTCMNTASGLFDHEGDDLILWGFIDEPMTPEQDKMVKYVYRGFGQDQWSLEIHDMMIGESRTKVLEFAFTRRK